MGPGSPRALGIGGNVELVGVFEDRGVSGATALDAEATPM